MARQVRPVSRQDLRKTTLASDPAHTHLAVATRTPFKPSRAAMEPVDRYGAAASARAGRRSGQGLQTGATARPWRTSARGVPCESLASALARQPTLMVRQIVSGPNCRACCDPLKVTEVEAGIAAVSGAMVQAAMRLGVVCAAARERHTERQNPSQLGRLSPASQGLYVNDMVVRWVAQMLYALFCGGTLTTYVALLNLRVKRCGPI